MKKVRIIAVLFLVLLSVFNIACFKNKNQVSGADKQKDIYLSDTENSDNSKREIRVADDKNVEDVSGIKNNSEQEQTSENIVFEKPVQSPLRTFPRLNVQILEGPVALEDGSLVYYRVHAKVLAHPKANLTFSKDDSLGAWGFGTAQINLMPGETYHLKIIACNEIGTSSAVVTLNWMEAKIDYGNTIISKDEDNPVFYYIQVSLEEQKTRVYYKDNLIREMICSTGAPETPTPVGTFKTGDKIFYSWLPKYDVGAYYFVRFFNSYLFHSIPFDDQGNIIKEEFDNLGKASSHGCVRFGMEDAKWFYENLPTGITMEVR